MYQLRSLQSIAAVLVLSCISHFMISNPLVAARPIDESGGAIQKCSQVVKIKHVDTSFDVAVDKSDGQLYLPLAGPIAGHPKCFCRVDTETDNVVGFKTYSNDADSTDYIVTAFSDNTIRGVNNAAESEGSGSNDEESYTEFVVGDLTSGPTKLAVSNYMNKCLSPRMNFATSVLELVLEDCNSASNFKLQNLVSRYELETDC